MVRFSPFDAECEVRAVPCSSFQKPLAYWRISCPSIYAATRWSQRLNGAAAKTPSPEDFQGFHAFLLDHLRHEKENRAWSSGQPGNPFNLKSDTPNISRHRPCRSSARNRKDSRGLPIYRGSWINSAWSQYTQGFRQISSGREHVLQDLGRYNAIADGYRAGEVCRPRLFNSQEFRESDVVLAPHDRYPRMNSGR